MARLMLVHNLPTIFFPLLLLLLLPLFRFSRMANFYLVLMPCNNLKDALVCAQLRSRGHVGCLLKALKTEERGNQCAYACVYTNMIEARNSIEQYLLRRPPRCCTDQVVFMTSTFPTQSGKEVGTYFELPQ